MEYSPESKVRRNLRLISVKINLTELYGRYGEFCTSAVSYPRFRFGNRNGTTPVNERARGAVHSLYNYRRRLRVKRIVKVFEKKLKKGPSPT